MSGRHISLRTSLRSDVRLFQDQAEGSYTSPEKSAHPMFTTSGVEETVMMPVEGIVATRPLVHFLPPESSETPLLEILDGQERRLT